MSLRLRSAPVLVSLASALAALATLVAACEPLTLTHGEKSDPAPGPIDGYYNLQSWSCSGAGTQIDLLAYTQAQQGYDKAVLGFFNQGASYLIEFGGSCGNNLAYAVSYDLAASTVTTADEARSCDVDCAPADCTPEPAPTPAQSETYGYALSGATLTLTRALSADDLQEGSAYLEAGCSAGMTETKTATLQ